MSKINTPMTHEQMIKKSKAALIATIVYVTIVVGCVFAYSIIEYSDSPTLMGEFVGMNFLTIFFGIYFIVRAIQIKNKVSQGDFEKAQKLIKGVNIAWVAALVLAFLSKTVSLGFLIIIGLFYNSLSKAMKQSDLKNVSQKAEPKTEKTARKSTDNKFCTECGAQSKQTAKFCEKCGNQF